MVCGGDEAQSGLACGVMTGDNAKKLLESAL